MKLERLSNLPTETGTRAPAYGAAALCTFSTWTERELSVAHPARARRQTAADAVVRRRSIGFPRRYARFVGPMTGPELVRESLSGLRRVPRKRGATPLRIRAVCGTFFAQCRSGAATG